MLNHKSCDYVKCIHPTTRDLDDTDVLKRLRCCPASSQVARGAGGGALIHAEPVRGR